MTLWIVLTTLIGITCAVLAVAVSRPRAARAGGPVADEAVRVRLADIEAQVAAGTMSGETAEGLRAEALRGYLASRGRDEPRAAALSRRAQMAVAVVVAALVSLGAALLYAKLGRPDVAQMSTQARASADAGLQTSTGAAGPAGGANPSLPQIIGQLEARVKAAPADVKAQQFLGFAYDQAGRYAEAAMAYRRAEALPGADPQDGAAEAEALTQAAGGQVTGPALAALKRTLALNPADPRARYLMGIYKDESGDHAGAMADWIALLKSAPPGAPWAPQIRAFVEKEAAQRGEDISKQLPPAPAGGPAPGLAGAGPQAPDPQAMVARLAQRLMAQPHDLDGWILMMRARMVLGQTDQAASAWHDGQTAFRSDPAGRAKLDAAAKSLGVPGA